MRLNYQGIGAHLQDEDGYATVKDIIPGGAAHKDGTLAPGDRIVAVAQGEEGEAVDVVGWRLTDVVKLIRGEDGTVVRLSLLPAGGGEPRVLRIVRARTELTEQAATGELLEHGRRSDGTPFRIGFIDLPSFYGDMEARQSGSTDFRSCTEDVRKLISGFTEQHADTLVLDLRRNGGGLLEEAVSLTGLFIDQGPVVQVKGPDGRARARSDRDPGMAWSGPLVVLTSRFSASASEILAGAIRDYRRGLVIGDSATHGKGTVQTVVDLASVGRSDPYPGNLGALKLTIQQFYRPDGLSTQRIGVAADVVIPSITDAMEEGEAGLPFALGEDRIRPLTHETLAFVEPWMADVLTKASVTRLASVEGFATLSADLALYRSLRERKTVSLNETSYLEIEKQLAKARSHQIRSLSAPSETTAATEATEPPGPESASGSAERRATPYFQEVLNVTVDYLDLLDDGKLASK
jgi:carboxyl-terminal processing protease